MKSGELPIPNSNGRLARPCGRGRSCWTAGWSRARCPGPRRAASAPARPGSRPQVWRDNPSRPARAPTGQKGPLVFSTVPGARAPRQVGGWRKAPRQRRLIQPRLGSGEDWMKERVQDVYAVVKGKGKERNHRVLV